MSATEFGVDQRGVALLEDPIASKGTAFDAGDRRALGLDGLLPPAVETLGQQALRAYEAFTRHGDDLARHIYLRALQDTNEVLFCKLVTDHVEEMLPIVYTPTVGLACQQFSHIYRRPRGLFLSYPHQDRLPQILGNRPRREVDAIVVTDGERILGLGDQGAGGLGIPIGKLSLYTAIGGIHPARTLPIVLDTGTSNRQLLEDPEYLGWRHERITGDAYAGFIDRFVQAAGRELPGTLLQWEDFATAHARPTLDRYRDRLLTFNDDIQGTAAVVAGALAGAVRASGSRLRDQRVVLLGAGSAAIGVADMLASMAGFARTQRVILSAAGVRISVPAIAATAWAGNAISVSLPLVGPGTGTAFTFGRFRRVGGDAAAAGWVLAISGVVSNLVWVLMLALGAAVSGNPRPPWLASRVEWPSWPLRSPRRLPCIAPASSRSPNAGPFAWSGG